MFFLLVNSTLSLFPVINQGVVNGKYKTLKEGSFFIKFSYVFFEISNLRISTKGAVQGKYLMM